MRLRTLGLLLMVSTAAVASPRVVAAQGSAGANASTPATAPVSAREAFKRGEAAYSAGNYDAAVREWTNAYSVDPRPRIQFNLSQAYERMGRLEDAIAALKSFLETGNPDEDPTWSDANARLVALQQRLAATGVVVQGGAEGGSILVDETDWGRTPRPDRITVPPGNHVIVVRWPSGQEFRTNVFVPAGQVVNITIPDEGGTTAQPTAGGAPTPAAGAPATTSAASGGSQGVDKRILWYSLGGGVAAAGVGMIIYGVVRGAATDKCNERDALGLTTYCNPDSVDKADRQSVTGYAMGGVLLAGGAALFVVGALTHKRDDRQAKTQCGVGLMSANCTFRF
jgi:hypothetical protein